MLVGVDTLDPGNYFTEAILQADWACYTHAVCRIAVRYVQKADFQSTEQQN